MRLLKNIFSRLHVFVLWALGSFLFWSWIFTFVTDAPAEKKVTVYCHVPQVEDIDLAVKLEEDMPQGIRMIKVHSFDYVMFDMERIERGDIFIIPESELETFREDLLPLSGEGGEQVYDEETGEGIAKTYISYGDEDYYLFLGSGSVHLEDGIAREIAMRILELP